MDLAAVEDEEITVQDIMLELDDDERWEGIKNGKSKSFRKEGQSYRQETGR